MYIVALDDSVLFWPEVYIIWYLYRLLESQWSCKFWHDTVPFSVVDHKCRPPNTASLAVGNDVHIDMNIDLCCVHT